MTADHSVLGPEKARIITLAARIKYHMTALQLLMQGNTEFSPPRELLAAARRDLDEIGRLTR